MAGAPHTNGSRRIGYSYVELMEYVARQKARREGSEIADNSKTGVIEDRIVGKKERREIIPYSDSHYNRLEKLGLVPKRFLIGEALDAP